MIRIALIVLLCAGLTVAGDFTKKKLLMKYGAKKIFESCFGEQQAKEYYEKVYRSMVACKNELDGKPSEEYDGTPARRGSIRRPGFDWEAFFAGNEPMRPRNEGGRPDYFFNRQKRDHHGGELVPFPAEKISKVRDAFMRDLKLGTCVLQRCEVLDSRMNVNWTAIADMYNKVEGSPELKEDLMEVMDKCKSYAECTTPSQRQTTFPVGLKQALKFMKCEKKKKLFACMKQDLRKIPQMFELEGLGGILDGSPYDEPEEQALKVLYLDEKYGDPDFSLFE